MTEAEWLACTNLERMLEFLQDRANDRKLQLFAVACCRRLWSLITDPRHRSVVEAAESFSDGLSSEAEFEQAMQPVATLWADRRQHVENRRVPFAYVTAATRHLGSGRAAIYAADFAARGLACLAGVEGDPGWAAACLAETAFQCALLRDIIGDPSCPFRFDPAWLAGEGNPAVDLARVIDAERRFEALPSLADALERVGCRDRAVLGHCRESNPHVRGCWVLDALLGRESAVRAGLVTEMDWQTCNDPEPLLHFLRDKGSNRKWRLFAVACCRRIDHLIADERSRRAVEVAARYADGGATEEEIEAARAGAEEAQREAGAADFAAEAVANFCETPGYAAANCRSCAAKAARSAACRNPRVTDAAPGSFEADYWRPSNEWSVAAVGEKEYAGMEFVQGDSRWTEARDAAEVARTAEGRTHCDLLRDLFGEHFGPPGDEACWLPHGPESSVPVHVAQQWCLLPTLRRVVLRREWLAWNDGTIPRLAQAIYEEGAFDRLPILADALEDAGCSDVAILDHLRDAGSHVRGCWVVDLLLGKS